MGLQALGVLADRGYFDGEEVLACEAIGVTPYVPKPLTSGSKAKLKKRMDQVEASMERYMAALETADRQEGSWRRPSRSAFRRRSPRFASRWQRSKPLNRSRTPRRTSRSR